MGSTPLGSDRANGPQDAGKESEKDVGKLLDDFTELHITGCTTPTPVPLQNEEETLRGEVYWETRKKQERVPNTVASLWGERGGEETGLTVGIHQIFSPEGSRQMWRERKMAKEH